MARAKLQREQLVLSGFKPLKVTIENGRPYFMAVIGGVVGLAQGRQYKVLVDTGGSTRSAMRSCTRGPTDPAAA